MSDGTSIRGPASRFVQHPRCPYCRDAVQPEDPKAACDACMTWHHAECWDALLNQAGPAGNTDVVLLKGLTEQNTALLIEQRVEEHLGLDHQPVAGEYRA